MPTVVLGVTGCIGAYKACEVLRELQRGGADVHVVMTENAARFVAPMTFEALSRHPVFLGVHALELVPRCLSRRGRPSTTFEPARRDHVEHVRALGPLGMPRRRHVLLETWRGDQDHRRSSFCTSANVRCSSAPSARSSSSRLASIIGSSVEGTAIGAPNANATRANGRGICVRSQLASVQCGLASI